MLLLTIFTLAFAKRHHGHSRREDACSTLDDAALGELLRGVARGFFSTNDASENSFCYLMPKSEEWPHLEPDSTSTSEPESVVVPNFRRLLRGRGGGHRGRHESSDSDDRGCGNQAKFSVSQGQFSSVNLRTEADDGTSNFECLQGDAVSFTVGDIVLNLPSDDTDAVTVLSGRRLLHGRGGRHRRSSGVTLTVPVTQTSADGDLVITFTCRVGHRAPSVDDVNVCVAEELKCESEYAYPTTDGASETAKMDMVCQNEDWTPRKNQQDWQGAPACPLV